MEIILNGNAYLVSSRATIHDVINKLEYKTTNYVVAVNMSIIPKSRYHEYWLQDNDKVEIVTAFQGG